MPSRRRFAERIRSGAFGTPATFVTTTSGGASMDPTDLATLLLSLPGAGATVAGDRYVAVNATGSAVGVLASEVRTFVLGISGGVAILPEALTIGGNFLSDTHATDDIGATGTRWKDGWFSGTVTATTLVGAAAAGTLSGTTLAANVVTSSLTTIGTLVAGAVPASLVTAGTFGTGNYTVSGSLTISGGSANPALLVTTTGTNKARFAYDGSNYLNVAVSSVGAVEFDAVGSATAFSFGDATTIQSTGGAPSALAVTKTVDTDTSTVGTSFTTQLTSTVGGTISLLLGFRGIARTTSGSTSTVTALTGIEGQVLQTGSSAITNGRAFHAVFVGAYTNLYGLYVDAVTGGSSLNYAIYTNAGLVRFGDDVSSTGNVEAASYSVGAAAGASFGPGMPTSITVVNGIITAIS